MHEARWESRRPYTGQFSLTWKGPDGATRSAIATGIDVSTGGVGVECATGFNPGALVQVAARDGSLSAQCEVVHCTRRGAAYHIGFELRQELAHKWKAAQQEAAAGPEQDYYEILQISRKADAQTIHRVFHIMAARFHPDNPETGDLEQFLRMKHAYNVLSDPDRRREYDATLERADTDGPRPIFRLKDFVTGVEAEANRRLGVLCLLYSQRQTDPDHPGVSLLDLEKEMGFPREYLSFTMWYLRSKELVALADNSDYALTAAGADFVEDKAAHSEIAARLLNQAAFRPRRGASPSRRDRAVPDSRLLV
jgi:curved DNA-binding protein CbpA